jgi:D-sedoheptulose 7-phosphate isomerase
MHELIQSALTTAGRTLRAFVQDEENLRNIEQMAEMIAAAFKNGGKVIIFGNGGSMCDAMHFAEELTGRYRLDRKPLPAIALSDPSYLTCVANDYGFDQVFARGVEALAKSGDAIIGLSTSGNSSNIINALQKANTLQCKTIALLGRDGGTIKGICDLELIIPVETSDRIQELHMLILHTLTECVEHLLFYSNTGN